MRSRGRRLSNLFFFAMIVGWLAAGCAERPEPVGRLGVSTSEIQLGYPQVAEIELSWEMSRALEGLSGQPRVFLHLIDSNGDMIRTFDHELPGPWKIGASQRYSVPIYQSALAPALEEGEYELTAGLYDQQGNRWPLESAGAGASDHEYTVATVLVVESGPQMPQFFFSSSWLPVEGGTDLQILARRWLTENGVIRLGAVPGPGKLWLNVGIPEGGGALQEPVMAAGAVEQSVTVTTTCGDAAVRVAGPGSHSVELSIAPPMAAEAEDDTAETGPAECEVRFEANYYLMSRDGDQSRTVALEGLSWSID